VVFGHFKYYLDSLRGEKTPREIADHIAGYVLQSEAYQTSRVDRFFLSNHFRICSDGDTQAAHRLTNLSDYVLLVRRIRGLDKTTREEYGLEGI
jgi:hypothetical protein